MVDKSNWKHLGFLASPELKADLIKSAESRGLGLSNYIRMVLVEKLKQERLEKLREEKEQNN